MLTHAGPVTFHVVLDDTVTNRVFTQASGCQDCGETCSHGGSTIPWVTLTVRVTGGLPAVVVIVTVSVRGRSSKFDGAVNVTTALPVPFEGLATIQSGVDTVQVVFEATSTVADPPVTGTVRSVGDTASIGATPA